MVAALAVLTLLVGQTPLPCPEGPTARSRAFSPQAMPGMTPAQRYRAYLGACGQKDAAELTARLVGFPTVSSEQPASTGRAFVAMRDFLRKVAAEHGLAFRVVGANAVFELSAGDGAPRLGFVLHGDVVPAPRVEWKLDPFTARVEGGRLYGRGAEDDKGPLAAALVTLIAARQVALPLAGRVLVIVGNGEESDWSGMKAYVEREPKPTYVVGVDSAFPVVVAQSGFVAWHLEADLADAAAVGGGAIAVDVRAGEFLTQVPGTAELTLAPRSKSAGALAEEARAALSELQGQRPRLRAEVKLENGRLKLTTFGQAVHSSTPEEGHNALWDLAALAQKLPLAPNGIFALLAFVARELDGDHHGTKLGLAHRDPLMGPLSVAPTLLRVEGDKVTLGINLRRPRGMDAQGFRAALDAATRRIAQSSGGKVRAGKEPHIGEPAVADTSGPLVTTLLSIYGEATGEKDPQPVAIRGGTYARLFPGAVEFGPAFPGQPYTGHAPDEFISLDSLGKTTRMLGEVVLRLASAP